MNHTKKALQLFAMIMVGATVFMGGCGPENLEDPAYLADLSTSESANDAQSDAMQASGDQGGQQQGEQMGQGDQMGQGGQMAQGDQGGQGGPSGGMGMGGMPAGGAVGSGGVAVAQPVVAAVPTPVPPPIIRLPDGFVQLPPEFAAEPPIVTATGEQVNFARNVLHRREIHVAQPSINNHLVTKNLHTNNLFQTDVIKHPSFQNNVAIAHTASISAEVLPTRVVVAPPVVLPGVVAPAFIPGPYCAPWFSGGLLRACGPGYF